LETEHRRAITVLEVQHQEAVTVLKARHQEAVAQLQSQNFQLRGELEHAQQMTNWQALEADFKTLHREQKRTPFPYAHWEKLLPTPQIKWAIGAGDALVKTRFTALATVAGKNLEKAERFASKYSDLKHVADPQ